jgi:hypothetical protein
MTKMVERKYTLEWREWCRVPVDTVVATLLAKRDRVLADGNEDALVDIGEDWEGRPELKLVGVRAESPGEQCRREAKEKAQQDRVKLDEDRTLKDALKDKSREEIEALWEAAQKTKK